MPRSPLADLLHLYAYDRWAAERTLTAAATVGAEGYDRPVEGSFASLRATLEHLLGASSIWLGRWLGVPLREPRDVAPCTSVAALRVVWEAHWLELDAFLATLREEELARPVFMRFRSGIETVMPLVDTMRHVVNHATYHRGQVTTLVRQLGGTPASTDYVAYCMLRPVASFDLQPVLRGELLELRPLQPHDFDALFAVAADPRIWEQHPANDRWKPDVFRAFFDDAIASRGAFLVLDRASGAVIGCTRYHGHDEATREIEIGWTFLARSHWGGRHNGEMKRLMLDHAFRFVDRVLFIVGPENRRSRRAVEKIGGVHTGERRDATGRESVVYTVQAPGRGG